MTMTRHSPDDAIDLGADVRIVRARAYTVPTDAPEGDGTLSWSATTLVLAEAIGGGRAGIGWTYAPPAAAALVADLLAGAVVGHPLADVPGAYAAMTRAVRNAGRPGVAAYAISAVDCALWDLKARVLGLPLHTLLGRVHDTVPVYGSGGFTPYDDDRTRRQLAGWVHDQGIPRVKIKIGEEWGTREARDLARMRLARQVIGPDAELYVDANGAYGAKQAVRVAEAAADADVRWFEEPVSSDDLDGLGLVRDRVTADVAAGEYGCDPGYFRRMCPYVDCLQADATRCGGVTGWLDAATVAAAGERDISAHCAPTLHTAIAGSVPNLRHLEWFHDHVRVENLLFSGVPEAVGGAARPGDAPGFGVVLRTADAEPYRVV